MKRFFDVSLSFLGLVFSSPLFLVFSLLVRGADRGPVFYIQERWGKEGRKFKVYKFRTMIAEADPPGKMRPALENDRRITRLGKFLRATALDELPQLVNILKGEMSFVGPRALAVNEISSAQHGFHERHRVRPGLTGLAQIYASRDASFEEKLCYDLNYVGKRTFLWDLKLILLSFWITLRGGWESRQKKS